MNNIQTLNDKQVSLVRQFEKLIKEMKNEGIICFNEKVLDHYDDDTPSYSSDKLCFINGKDIETISSIIDTNITDDMVIPSENDTISMNNFIQATNIDNPMGDYTLIACTIKD